MSWFVPLGVVALMAFGCEPPEATFTKPNPSASATATSQPSASSSPSTLRRPPDWATAVDRLRDALKTRGVKLVYDTEKEVRVGCDDQLRKHWRTGPVTRAARCYGCTRITKEMIEDTHVRSPIDGIESLTWALASYSPALMKKTELETVRLCGDIVSEHEVDSEGRTGMVDPMDRTVLLALSRESMSVPPRTFHHEMMHVFDNSVLFNSWAHDDEWFATNAPNFEYGKLRQGEALPKGIVTHYASTKATEDRAEVFAQIMVLRPEVLCTQLVSDARFAAKANIIRSRLTRSFGNEAAFVDQRLQCAR